MEGAIYCGLATIAMAIYLGLGEVAKAISNRQVNVNFSGPIRVESEVRHGTPS